MAEKNSIKLEVMTPSKLFYRGMVDLVIVTTVNGDEGFMAGHCWGCKLLDIGELWIQEAGADKNEWRVASVVGGFVDVKDSIVIYTDHVEWAEDIDLERAKKQVAEAKEWLEKNEITGDPDDVIRAKLAITRNLTRTNVAEGSTRHH